MIDSKKSLRPYIIMFFFFFVITFLISSCDQQPSGPDDTDKVENGGPGPVVEPADFTWDPVSRTPRWRLNSPIEWYPVSKKSEVIAQSRETGKPIFAYVSSIDKDLTATVEDGLFPADVWGTTISNIFVAWEVDENVNPAEAMSLLGGRTAPALFVLKPSPDAGSDELRAVDSWFGRELLSFPLHQGIIPLGNPAADDALQSFISADFTSCKVMEIPPDEIDPDVFIQDVIDGLLDRLDSGSGLYPEEALYLAYLNKYYLLETPGLEDRYAAWSQFQKEYFSALAYLPDEAFITGAGWGINPTRSVDAVLGASILGLEYSGSDLLFQWMYDSLTMESGDPGGGFAPYYDIRGSFSGGDTYLDDNSRPAPGITHGFQDVIAGPRTTVWANARMLSLMMKLVKSDPAFFVATVGNTTAGEFLFKRVPLMLGDMEGQAGSPSSMRLNNKIFMLDMYNEIYQLTGDIIFLNKAAAIAETFYSVELDTWFNPSQLPLMPGLALAMHHYSWLAHNEDAMELAKEITEESVKYSGSFSDPDSAGLALAYEVVHTECIHTAILGPASDDLSKELLFAALEGYDPRKIAQMLDPERDLELIEAKGYYPMEGVMAFVCLNEICYPRPFRDADSIREIMAQAVEDVRTGLE